MIESICQLPSRTIGIDLGDRESHYCAVDDTGKMVVEGKVLNERPELERLFRGHPSRIILEASGQSHWISQLLRAMGHEVVVANPRRLRLISHSTSKTDRNDARLLARIGRLDVDLLGPVHQRGERCFSALVLLRARRQLVRIRTKLINLVRSETKVLGSRIPSCAACRFYRTARTHLPAELRLALEPILDELECVEAKIQKYDQSIKQLCKEQFPETGVLLQVHGVGVQVALAYAATIEDPRRFAQSRSVGAYLGLTPRSHQSGSNDPRLRISKHGDTDLRSLLVTASACILRSNAPNCDLKRYGKKISRGGTPRDRGRARIAVARKLAVLLHRLWLTGEVYNPNQSALAAS